ncbi:hypothetical protein EJB05_15576 [Eragrostis curvula]|uniref:Uncharacterized protein n=1 Tax=Eragrostis curvula TaxID=38414 RepID=A0A5J9VCB8_9POAL|nr:hypothetical protein EJB05_15576 [Eragrostis curvula]
MIKRRFFKQDHGDNSGSSSSSSSSGSDSDRDPEEEEVADEEAEEQEEEQESSGHESGEEEELEPQVQKESSGYQSEDSSGNDVDGPSVDDDEDEHISPRIKEHPEISLPAKKASYGNVDSTKDAAETDDATEADFTNYILKCKSVYKCKLCPRIMCLNEEMVRVHLKSKRHARSKKLLGEGRLKLMLNSDGELEEEQETHAERHARTIALAQQVQKAKKDSGRQRQNRRRKKRSQNPQEKKQEAQKSDKKRRKTEG